MSSFISNEARLVVATPTSAVVVDPGKLTPEEVGKMIFKGELKSRIKPKSMLDDNIQKSCSLVTGQRANLLLSKLKEQAQWSAVSQEQDAVLALISLIKMITLHFKDQSFLPLALHQSKANLHNLRQSIMTNNECLQWFQNLVDVACCCLRWSNA